MAPGEWPEQVFELVPEGMGEDPTVTFNPNKTKAPEVGPAAGGAQAADPKAACGDFPATVAPAVGGAGATASADAEFEFRRILGQGGFGVVWEGVQKSLRRVVAIKRVRGERLKEVESHPERRAHITQSFREEALTSAQLDHPNIVPVYELGEDESGLPVLAMKLVAGDSWDGLLAADWRRWSVDDYLAKHIPILLDVAQAVAFAHSRGIVHRDLKPSQVMVGEFGEVLLMDWGLAIAFDEKLLYAAGKSVAIGAAPSRESARNPAGTPAFMAPEQTEATAENIGPWTDVYLLGGTLYNILTGAYPHGSRATQQAMAMARAGIVVAPAGAAPDRAMPEELLALMNEALSPRIEDRRMSAKDFVRRLQDYMSGTGKRRESEAIARDVAAKLEAGTRDYEELSECVAALGRARTLWPGNPAVAGLRERALVAFGRAALNHGDYILARVQTNRLDAGSERDALLADIAIAEERARSVARTRRYAIAAVMALIVVIAVGSLIFNHQLKKEIAAKEIARTEAVRFRSEAERIISYFVTDLNVSLGELRKLELLEGASREALKYFENTRENYTPSDALLRARALNGLGDVLYEMARYDECQKAYEEALATCDEALAALPGDSVLLREKAQAINNIGVTFEIAETAALAIEEHLQALKIRKALDSAKPNDPGLMEDLAQSYQRIGFCKWIDRDLDSALEFGHQAEALRRRVHAMSPNSTRAVKQLCSTLHWLSTYHQYRKEAEPALNARREELALAEGVLEKHPDNIDMLEAQARSRSALSGLLFAKGEVDEAQRLESDSLAALRLLCRADPLNAGRRHRLGTALLAKAWRIQRSDCRGGLELCDETISLYSQNLKLDPSNGIAVQRLSETHRAAYYCRRECKEDGTASGRAAIEVYASYLAAHPDDYNASNNVAKTCLELATTWDDRAEALEFCKRACDILESAIANKRLTQPIAASALSAHAALAEGAINAADIEGWKAHVHRGLELGPIVSAAFPSDAGVYGARVAFCTRALVLLHEHSAAYFKDEILAELRSVGFEGQISTLIAAELESHSKALRGIGLADEAARLDEVRRRAR